MIYSIGLFIWGSLGDHFNIKIILITSFVLVNAIISVISLGGASQISSLSYYCIFFAINGALQSSGFPLLTAVFSNWFGKKGRGILFGLWTSNAALGNIIGSLITSFLTQTLKCDWYTAYAVIGCFCTLFAILIFFFLIIHPEDIGIYVEEVHDSLKDREKLLDQDATKWSIQESLPSF